MPIYVDFRWELNRLILRMKFRDLSAVHLSFSKAIELCHGEGSDMETFVRPSVGRNRGGLSNLTNTPTTISVHDFEQRYSSKSHPSISNSYRSPMYIGGHCHWRPSLHQHLPLHFRLASSLDSAGIP